jgi:sugar lactone lactonase YvrE
MKVELIADCRNLVGESPVWVDAQNTLYWVDITGKRLWSWNATTGDTVSWSTAEMPGCIAPATRGLVCGMESGVFWLEPMDPWQGVRCTKVSSVTHAAPEMRFNDGRCDRQGRFVAGTMALGGASGSAWGELLTLTAERRLSSLVRDLIVPNGLAFSPDGATLYRSDSHPSRQSIWKHQYDVDTGTLGPAELFVDMTALPGRPDGAAVDETGCYWICANDAGMIHRFTPEGRLDRSVRVPVGKPSMCAFGGSDLKTLFVTSIGRPSEADVRADWVGAVFAICPGVRGLPETPWRSPTPADLTKI